MKSPLKQSSPSRTRNNELVGMIAIFRQEATISSTVWFAGRVSKSLKNAVKVFDNSIDQRVIVLHGTLKQTTCGSH